MHRKGSREVAMSEINKNLGKAKSKISVAILKANFIVVKCYQLIAKLNAYFPCRYVQICLKVLHWV